jgi:hypothetical protein
MALRRTRFAVSLQTLNIGGVSPQPKDDSGKTSAQAQQACKHRNLAFLIYPLHTDWQMIRQGRRLRSI